MYQCKTQSLFWSFNARQLRSWPLTEPSDLPDWQGKVMSHQPTCLHFFRGWKTCNKITFQHQDQKISTLWASGCCEPLPANKTSKTSHWTHEDPKTLWFLGTKLTTKIAKIKLISIRNSSASAHGYFVRRNSWCSWPSGPCRFPRNNVGGSEGLGFWWAVNFASSPVWNVMKMAQLKY